MFNLLTNYEFDIVMHIHEHTYTPYMIVRVWSCKHRFKIIRFASL